MGSPPGRVRALYGAGAPHALTMMSCFALAAYATSVLGFSALWGPDAWWESILVWFVGAVILHDLVLFPLYALVDRSIRDGLQVVQRHRSHPAPRVSPLNYVRLPVLAVGLLFLLFFPGILEQGASSYLDATGQTQEPFLRRWLLLAAVIFGASAIGYAARLAFASTRSTSTIETR